MPAANESTARPEELLSVGEMSRRTGVPVSALHYYERLDLIASQRTAGNQRRYPRYMLRRVALISVAKRLGIPLSEVAEHFQTLPDDRMPSLRDWTRLNKRWRAQLRERQLELERLQSEMDQCIGCGCISLNHCLVINPGDTLAAEGPGARRLLPFDGANPAGAE